MCAGSIEGDFANTGDLLVFVDEQPTKPGDFDMKYELSTRRASHIIEGSGLYTDKLAFLREVIQNALDATKRQLFVDLKRVWEPLLCELGQTWEEHMQKAQKYEPFLDMPAVLEAKKSLLEQNVVKVRFSVEGDDLVITVTDQGIGITRERLKKMQQVGDIPPMDNYRNMPSWLKPTGDFGIGMQSIFMVVDHFQIKTRPWERENDKDMQRRIQFYSTRLGGDIFNCEEDVDVLNASVPQQEQLRRIYPHGTTVEIRINLKQPSKYLAVFLPKNKAGIRMTKDYRLNFAAVFQQEVEQYIKDAFIGEVIPIRLRFDKSYTQAKEEYCIDKYAPLHTPGYVSNDPLWENANACDRLYYVKDWECEKGRPGEEGLFYWYFRKRPAPNENVPAHNIFISLQLRRTTKDAPSKTRLFYRGIRFSDSGSRWTTSDERPMEDIIRVPGFQCDINLMYGTAGEIIEINREYIKHDHYTRLWQELRDSVLAFFNGIDVEFVWLAENNGQDERRQLLAEIKTAWEKGSAQGVVIDRKDKVVLFHADNTFMGNRQESLYLTDIGDGDITRQRLLLKDPDIAEDPCEDPRTHLPRILYAKEVANSEIKKEVYSEVHAFAVMQEGAPAFQIFRLIQQPDDFQHITCERNLPLINDYSYRLIVRDIIRRCKENNISKNYHPVFPARKADIYNGSDVLIVGSVPIGASAYEVGYYNYWIISPYPLCKLESNMPFFPFDDEWGGAKEYPLLQDYIIDAASSDKKPTPDEIAKAYRKWLRVLWEE
jgi:hypothetical protein